MADGGTAAAAYTIGWEPQLGPQTALLACPVFEVFFGGARGGRKTDGMLGEWASHADLHGKSAVGLMVRRERVQLLETIERSRQIYGPLGARYNDQDKMWRWPNGARLRFAYLERDADADAYPQGGPLLIHCWFCASHERTSVNPNGESLRPRFVDSPEWREQAGHTTASDFCAARCIFSCQAEDIHAAIRPWICTVDEPSRNERGRAAWKPAGAGPRVLVRIREPANQRTFRGRWALPRALPHANFAVCDLETRWRYSWLECP